MRKRTTSIKPVTAQRAEFVNGAWVVTQMPEHPDRPNFVICCPYGDWSGFRTFAECIGQEMSNLRPNYFFWVEER